MKGSFKIVRSDLGLHCLSKPLYLCPLKRMLSLYDHGLI